MGSGSWPIHERVEDAHSETVHDLKGRSSSALRLTTPGERHLPWSCVSTSTMYNQAGRIGRRASARPVPSRLQIGADRAPEAAPQSH